MKSRIAHVTALALFLGLAILPAPVRAQGADNGEVLPTDEGTTKLQNQFKSKAITEAFASMVAGSSQPTEKSEAIDVAAQWYAYRLTWDDYLAETKNASKSISAVQAELDRKLKEIWTLKGDNKKFAGLFTKQLARRVMEVMEKGKIRARVNGGIMLQRLGQTGYQALVPDMVEVLENAKYPDYVKLYAIKGLGELLERQPPLPAPGPARHTHLAKYAKALSLLIGYIEKAPEAPKDAAPIEKVRIEDVHRFFRREAVRALGQFRQPALEIDAKSKKVEAPVAYWLLKVAANDGMFPSASLGEQVEAAYGLLLMNSDGSSYDPDLALYVVGNFIEKDFIVKYNADWDRSGKVAVNLRPRGRRDRAARSKEPIPVRAEPWRIHSMRLQFALEEMRNAAKNPATQKKIDDVLARVKPAVAAMQPLTKSKQVDPPVVSQLQAAVDKIKPAELNAYKGFAGFAIKINTDE